MQLTTFNTAMQIREDIDHINDVLEIFPADTPEIVSTNDIRTLATLLDSDLADTTDPSIAEVINTANANYYTALRTALTAKRDAMEASFANLQDPQG